MSLLLAPVLAEKRGLFNIVHSAVRHLVMFPLFLVTSEPWALYVIVMVPYKIFDEIIPGWNVQAAALYIPRSTTASLLIFQRLESFMEVDMYPVLVI